MKNLGEVIQVTGNDSLPCVYLEWKDKGVRIRRLSTQFEILESMQAKIKRKIQARMYVLIK